MKFYGVGLLFTDDLSRVVLIRKVTPPWQTGLLNGPGGKVEYGESAAIAMRREFQEETGVDVETWEPMVCLLGSDDQVWFFRAVSTAAVGECRPTTGEIVEDWVVARVVHRPDLVPNLHWILPFAADPCCVPPLVVQARASVTREPWCRLWTPPPARLGHIDAVRSRRFED